MNKQIFGFSRLALLGLAVTASTLTVHAQQVPAKKKYWPIWS